MNEGNSGWATLVVALALSWPVWLPVLFVLFSLLLVMAWSFLNKRLRRSRVELGLEPEPRFPWMGLFYVLVADALCLALFWAAFSGRIPLR